MSTAIQTTKPTGLSAWVANEDVRGKFAAMLGDTIPVDQFVSHMMTAFQDANVVRCSDISKYQAIHECAVLSLLPTLGQVSLIPYGDELKAMPQWQGYKAVMERHPLIEEVMGVLVHVDDMVSYCNGELYHEYDPLDAAREIKSAADIRGGYCRIIYTTGRPPKYHFTTVAHIVKAQGCAKTQNVWTKWYEQMAMKTLYRDCYARRAVPIDPLVGERLKQITKFDDINLGNNPDRVPDAAQPRPLTTADIMGTMEPEQEPPSAGPEMPLHEEYIVNISEITRTDDLDQLDHTVDISTELSADKKEIVLAAIKKRKAYLTRGERSNTPT